MDVKALPDVETTSDHAFMLLSLRACPASARTMSAKSQRLTKFSLPPEGRSTPTSPRKLAFMVSWAGLFCWDPISRAIVGQGRWGDQA